MADATQQPKDDFGIKELPANFSGRIVSVSSLSIDDEDPGRSLVELAILYTKQNALTGYDHDTKRYHVPFPFTHRNEFDVVRLMADLDRVPVHCTASYAGNILDIVVATHYDPDQSFICGKEFTARIDLERMIAVHEKSPANGAKS